MLYDCTNLQISKKADMQGYQLIAKVGKLEIISPETAENPEMLSILLRLIKNIYKAIDNKEIEFQDTARFWNAIKPFLISTLQVCPDDKYYLYQISSANKAIRILIWITMKSREQNPAFLNIDVILSRLLIEFHNLTKNDEHLCYSQNILLMNPKLQPKVVK